MDTQRISIPSYAPAVAYKVIVGLDEPVTGRRLGEVELPSRIHILPKEPIRPKDIPHRLGARFGESLRLLGYRVEREGEVVHLTLYWQAERQPAGDYHVFVHLVDESKHPIAQADGPPLEGAYPTSMWWPGQIIPDERDITLPAGRVSDTLLVGLYDLATMQRLPAYKDGDTRWPDDAVVIPLGA